jgi:quercetin dioxygenase-like cupin family protein
MMIINNYLPNKNFIMGLLVMAFSFAMLPALHATEIGEPSIIQIHKNGSAPLITGDASYFTGKVTITGPFKGTPPARVSGATVTFAPGARTAWHKHPLGQTLIVTSGHGFVQEEGGPIKIISSGDVVWIPPDKKHWHGASPDSSMTHIAISEVMNGKTVDWLEHVSDDQYLAQ